MVVPRLCRGSLSGFTRLESARAMSCDIRGTRWEQFGTFYTGPWEKPDNARIRALQLNFKVVVLPDGDSINQKIHQYVSQKKPLLIFN